jgi:3-methyladenine DNA glycosylase/8-oxoguanine DNA glycosylase
MAALRALPGIGASTAEYVALRALSEPDAFPSADLVLRRTASGRACAAHGAGARGAGRGVANPGEDMRRYTCGTRQASKRAVH